MLLAQNNIPSAFAEKVNPVLLSIFSDSNMAKNYKMCKTRASCKAIEILASYFLQQAVDIMKINFEFLSTDSYNDTGIEKINPLTVHFCDINTNRIDTQFLNICCTMDQISCTAAIIT